MSNTSFINDEILPDSEIVFKFIFLQTDPLPTPESAAITRSNSPRTRVSPFAIPQTQSVLHRTHDEALSIVAMRVNNPDCSPRGVNG
jgi:hypothetical protein